MPPPTRIFQSSSPVAWDRQWTSPVSVPTKTLPPASDGGVTRLSTGVSSETSRRSHSVSPVARLTHFSTLPIDENLRPPAMKGFDPW